MLDQAATYSGYTVNYPGPISWDYATEGHTKFLYITTTTAMQRLLLPRYPPAIPYSK